MNRRNLILAGLAALAAPKSVLAAQDKTIPYVPRDAFPYYDPITELKAKHVDPKIWPAVREINKSGWVWTAESCQGHRKNGWSDCPLLRLVCRSEHVDRLTQKIALAQRVGVPDARPLVIADSVELRRHAPAPRGWFEVRVYVRRGGIAYFERFAKSL